MFDHPEILRFARIASLLAQKGWAEANAGNLSVMLEKSSLKILPNAIGSLKLEYSFPSLRKNLFLVTATKSRARDVLSMPDKCIGLVELGNDGVELLCRWGTMPPTSEFPAHLSIYSACEEKRPEIRAVLHTHPPNIIALSHLPDMRDDKSINSALKMMHPEVGILLPEGISLVNFAVPGSVHLGQETSKALETCRVALWQMHGVVSIAENLDIALDQVEIVEKAAMLYLLVRATGQEPLGLTKKQILESRKFWGISGDIE